MKILIIEDDKDIVQFIKSGLESAMFTVDAAFDGERGSFLGRTGSYDLIIIDGILPKLNGPAIIRELRADNKTMPILMLTVKAEIKDKTEAFDAGADDYLTKPFLFDELLLRVKALLRRPPHLENKIYKVDNLSLNQDTKIVRRNGREIYLTRREFALLEHLMKNRNQIVPRSQILEQVWDYNADPFSNSIETHMVSLRKKINAGKQKNLIHTFVGRGYKLALRKLEGAN